MLFRWLARLWHWLTEAEPWNRHAPYPHGDPPSDRGGMGWPADDDD